MVFAMTPASIRTHASSGSARGARSSGSTMPAAAASSVRASSSAPFASAKRHRRVARARASLGSIGGARADRGTALAARSHAFRALASSDDADDASSECPVCDPPEATGVQPRAMDANDIDYKMMALSVAVGLAVRFAFPVPETLTPRAWTLFAIFASTVTGLVAKPAPVGAWAFMALTFTVATETLTFQEGLAALTNEVIWLIVVATFFARAFIKTGFGDRLGLLFVKAFGHTTLRLAYGLQTAEAVLSPAMPSTTARAAGVFVPGDQLAGRTNARVPDGSAVTGRERDFRASPVRGGAELPVHADRAGAGHRV
jgi:hypothetical protein